jgi:ribosome biogenesis GTPase A/predicted  nucleic acid-binding Zn-ribbon protein
MEKVLKELKLSLKGLHLDHLAKYVDDLYRSMDKVHIAFVGEYNAGKSSLINTLLGKKILAERDLPTTNRVVLITYCPVEKREKLDKYTELLCLKDEKLKYITLVDTPGLSSAVFEHEEALLRYLHKADLITIVAPSTQVYSKEIENLLKQLSEKHSTQWAYVINIFEDPEVYEEDPEKLTRLKEFVREKLRNILSSEDVKSMPIFAFSIRRVRKGITDDILTGDWEAFKRFIFEEVAEKAKKIKFAALKEKILKALSGEEILQRERELEELKREIEHWKNLRKKVESEIYRSVETKKRLITERVKEITEELKKEIDLILSQYGRLNVVLKPKEVLSEIDTYLRVKYLSTDKLSELVKLLDYRPDFVRLKKLYPELVVEPTIPTGLKTLEENFKKELQELPEKIGKPGALSKWLLPLGVIAAVAGGILFFQPKLKEYGEILLIIGGIAVFLSLLGFITAKGSLKSNFESRLNLLREGYTKVLTSKMEQLYNEKTKKVFDYIDTRLGKLNKKKEYLERELTRLNKALKELQEKY